MDYKSASYKIQVDDEAGSQVLMIGITPQYLEILEKQEDLIPFRSRAQQTITEDEKIKGKGQSSVPELLTGSIYAL